MSLPRTPLARALMEDFALRTGLDSSEPPRRYLWTDAFAVCTDLALHGRTGDAFHLDRARRLVDQVHRVLGRHRDDDDRSGWISGLDEERGAEHPTAGGLRIGKTRPERAPDEPPAPRLEWERDGQYFHYLTRWMHGLERMAEATGDPVYLRWALELARAAQSGFTYRSNPDGPVRIHWKMSIDLTRPLVESQGAHDPLDGFVTLRSLQAAGERAFGDRPGPRRAVGRTAADGPPPAREWQDLARAVTDLREACRGRSWVTDDALGIGGLLLNLHRMARLAGDGVGEEAVRWSERLAADARASLDVWSRRGPLEASATRRLAFRELGLALGLEGVADLRRRGAGEVEGLAALDAYTTLGRAVESFWSDPAHRSAPTWIDHRDINEVMLATSLVPEGYLGP